MFKPMTTYATGNFPLALAAADFNGDNITDIIVTNGGSNLLNLFLIHGNGSFTPQTDQFIISPACSIRVDDFDHDYIADIVVTSRVVTGVLYRLAMGMGLSRQKPFTLLILIPAQLMSVISIMITIQILWSSTKEIIV